MVRTPKQLLAGTGLCGLLFLAMLALAYWSDTARELDAKAVQGFLESIGQRIEPQAEWFVHLGDPLPVVLAGGVLAFVAVLRARPRVAAAVVFLVFATSVSSQALKQLLAYPRFEFGYITTPDAFPSGHTTAAATLALCLMLVVPGRLRPLAAVVGGGFALGMAFSLLFIQSHFPSDVVGGLLLAAGWTLAVAAALVAAQGRWPERTGRSRVARASRAAVDRVAAVGLATVAIVGTLTLVLAGAAILLTRFDDVVEFAERHTAALIVGPLVALAGIAVFGAVALALRRGA